MVKMKKEVMRVVSRVKKKKNQKKKESKKKREKIKINDLNI